MTDLYFRSYNPIWDFRSLTGLPLDDTSWAYFLSDQIPYFPQNVYQTQDGTPWPSPVQLSAAGTLENIFFDPALVYRIEIRTNVGNLTPPTQADALVWLVEHYIPINGGGGNTPTSANLAPDNQITNPQFALINFSTPLTLSNQSTQTISVGPGWDLVLTGASSNVVLTQLSLNSTNPNPTNAPYALEITLTGWTSAYLRQRFEQNGIQWANKYVSGSITARINGTPQTLTSVLVDSDDNTLATIITATITSTYEEYLGTSLLPTSVNPDLPPDAYIEYRINLPGSIDISITSIQVVPTDINIQITYDQDTIERQIDHTFHNYKDSILLQPKDSILTGWDFPLNPWQFNTTSATTVSSTGGTYNGPDQTIVVTEQGSSVTVGANTDGSLQIASIISETQGRVAVIQYIDPTTAFANWSTVLSSMAMMSITTSESTNLVVKMKLIYSASLPSQENPIASWGTVDPVFTDQWTVLSSVNDPAWTLISSYEGYSYNSFATPSVSGSTQTLGMVLYTTTPMSSIASDTWNILNVSLTKTQFAIEANPLSWDETLRRCQFYYEKSYPPGVFSGDNSQDGAITLAAPVFFLPNAIQACVRSFTLVYNSVKRTSPSVLFFAPSTGASGTQLQVNFGNSQPSPDGGTNPAFLNISSYVLYGNSINSITYFSNDTAPYASFTMSENSAYEGLTLFHYTADARLGLVA